MYNVGSCLFSLAISGLCAWGVESWAVGILELAAAVLKLMLPTTEFSGSFEGAGDCECLDYGLMIVVNAYSRSIPWLCRWTAFQWGV